MPAQASKPSRASASLSTDARTCCPFMHVCVLYDSVSSSVLAPAPSGVSPAHESLRLQVVISSLCAGSVTKFSHRGMGEIVCPS